MNNLAQHRYEMPDDDERAELEMRYYEAQQTQLEDDPDYFGEQLFEHGLEDGEKCLIGRALCAYSDESKAVEAMRNRIATLNAEHMAKHARRFA